jgi:hypothetical protein
MRSLNIVRNGLMILAAAAVLVLPVANTAHANIPGQAWTMIDDLMTLLRTNPHALVDGVGLLDRTNPPARVDEILGDTGSSFDRSAPSVSITPGEDPRGGGGEGQTPNDTADTVR